MGHREDLLRGAVACLREKGYERTTARDIVAASGTNLGSIGYHYGSTQALLNEAVIVAIGDIGASLAEMATSGIDPGEPLLTRFERYWSRVIDSFEENRLIWAASIDVFGVAERVEPIREVLAQGMQDARTLWSSVFGRPDMDEATAHAIGSIHQALLSGVLVQWLLDPDRAPTAGALAHGLAAIAADVTGR